MFFIIIVVLYMRVFWYLVEVVVFYLLGKEGFVRVLDILVIFKVLILDRWVYCGYDRVKSLFLSFRVGVY